jgi:Mg/Co/Ni transporter MgtE
VAILRADPSVTLGSVVRPLPAHVHPDWDLHATSRTMSDFNLTMAPVLDAEHHVLLGVVTVDDLLELLLPQGWRREFGMSSAEEA